MCSSDLFPHKKYHKNDICNGAQSAAWAMDLPYQVDHIVETLKSAPNVNFDEDWKLMTVLIGANDVCYSCWDKYYQTKSNPDYYEKWVRTTLEQVHSKIPRVFVNLVLMFNISQVHYVAKGNLHCEFAQQVIGDWLEVCCLLLNFLLH